MKVVITAAGLGTRLLPVTSTGEKVMLPLVNKPAIQYVVEEAVESGVKDIIFIVGPDDKGVRKYFSDKQEDLIKDLRSRGKDKYADELEKIKTMANYEYVIQDERKGLGDAVLRAKGVVGKEPFAVLYGDGPVTDTKVPRLKQLIDVHEKYNGAPVLAAKIVPDEMVSRYGIINYDDVEGEDRVKLVRGTIEKPSPEEVKSRYAISAGSILTSDIFDILENLEPGVGNEIQLTDAMNKLAQKRNMYAVAYEGERLDVGNPETYAKAFFEVALKEVDGFEEYAKKRLGSD